MREGRNIQIIEWDDLDKKKFYLNSIVLASSLRLTIYPTNLVKTRLQAQEGTRCYKGVFDAFKQIITKEGIKGLYKGFPVSLLHVIAGQFYITTYETSKQTLYRNHSTSLQHLCAGFTASLASQTVMVPVDIISQHQQVMGTSKISHGVNLSKATGDSQKMKRMDRIGQSVQILRHIVRSEGVRGLYKGYVVSLCTYGSNSALYWLLYYVYSELIEDLMSLRREGAVLREPLRIVTAGLLASLTSTVLTNPLDVIRTRFQLQMSKSAAANQSTLEVYRTLISAEGYRGLSRGLYARMFQSSFSSCCIVLAYEYMKKISLKDGVQPKHSSSDGGKWDPVTDCGAPANLGASGP